MKFEWGENKNILNKKKHSISFESASKVFDDYNRIEIYDNNHSLLEDRYITIGMAQNYLLILYVSYIYRNNSIRIFSARVASKEERKEYYDCEKRNRRFKTFNQGTIK